MLGLGWNPPTDTIYVKFNVNLSQKGKGKGFLGPDLNEESLMLVDKRLLTRRKLLSVINSIYDPLGLVTPVTIRLKVAFRNLFKCDPALNWNDLIPSADQETWYKLIEMLVKSKSIVFPRATRPPNAFGKSQMVSFFDGSDVAYVIYVRWTLDNGSVVIRLMSCKSRVTPLQRISTPRSELNGALLASRLVLSTLRSLSPADEIPERVWIIGDSECTLASIEKVSAAFGEYFGNHIGEVLDNQAKIEQFCPVGLNGEWWFIVSKDNAADQATRLDTGCSELGPDSEWQNGPSFLKSPQLNWPVNRDFAERKEDYIPQAELLKKYRCLIQMVDWKVKYGVDQIIDPYCTNDWEKLINKTQLLLIPFHKIRYGESDVGQRVVIAKNLWFRSVMDDTNDALVNEKFKELDVKDIDGLKVVLGRAEIGLQKFFGKNYLPVIMGHTRVAELIMMSAHWKDHTGRDITMATARHEAWIINAKKLAKLLIRRCVRCHIGVDLCSPYTVKSMTNKRATMKVWVVILLCLNIKAISMELTPGYSTEDFMLAYVSHVSEHGSPSFVHSDRGSQLVAAKKELCNDILKYDWDAIAAATSYQGTTWKFAPAGGQWRNGAAESFVKKFKQSFYHLYRETRMNYAELSCAVKRIANILNNRPISVQRTKTDEQEEDFLSPLTPNMLITGRSGSVPPKDYLDTEDPHENLSFIDELERAWWYQYKVQYFQSLIPTRKWIDEKRNISSGDVVLIEYKSRYLLIG